MRLLASLSPLLPTSAIIAFAITAIITTTTAATNTKSTAPQRPQPTIKLHNDLPRTNACTLAQMAQPCHRNVQEYTTCARSINTVIEDPVQASDVKVQGP